MVQPCLDLDLHSRFLKPHLLGVNTKRVLINSVSLVFSSLRCGLVCQWGVILYSRAV